MTDELKKLRDELALGITCEEGKAVLLEDGSHVTYWSDEWQIDCAEDLIWGRVISGVVTDSFKAGFDQGYSAARLEAKVLEDAVELGYEQLLYLEDLFKDNDMDNSVVTDQMQDALKKYREDQE